MLDPLRSGFDLCIVNQMNSGREKLFLQYAISLAAKPSDPAHDLYEKIPQLIKSFGLRVLLL